MNKLIIILSLIGVCFLQCKGREPFKPAHGSVPYVAFFPSRYRGVCVGVVVSRMAVMTAAVCVVSFKINVKDTRPINVVVGASYRHQRRGIRVQVTRILVPKMSTTDLGERADMMSKSVAIMILKRKIPEALMEIPIKPVEVDWKTPDHGHLEEECLMAGWHFFYRGDQIIEPHKYLLQRNLRVQFLNIVKKDLWCEPLVIGFEKALQTLGFSSYFDKSGTVCVKDGMYGAPLLCRGKVIGMMTAPDAQWTNCTGFSNIIHLLSNTYLRRFMECVSRIFEAPDEDSMSWSSQKKALYAEDYNNGYDYVHDVYDTVIPSSSSSEAEL